MISASRFKKPDVSVIVPVYNTKPYLKKCLNSLLNQTLKNIEIIVVDDGSTDGSADLIDAYAKKHKNIVPIHKKNGGVGSVYNIALKRVTGNYVGIIDSDDWTGKQMFRKLYDIAKKTQADVIKSACHWCYKKGKEKKRRNIPINKCRILIENPLAIAELVLGHPAHWTAIYRSNFLKKIKMKLTENPKDIASDIEFIYKVWLNLKSIYIISTPFVHYRLDRPTAKRNSHSEMSFRLLNVHYAVRKYFLAQKAGPVYWDIKTYNEFHHLKFELQQRCADRRKEFIYKLSQLFWTNLNENRIVPIHFKWKDLFFYHVIACFPFLYVLNDKIRLWITRPTPNNQVVAWRFFGLWQWKWGSHMLSTKNKKKKFYLMGLRLF